MELLLLKLGASGDVVRTSALLRRLGRRATWVTDAGNLTLIQGVRKDLRTLAWEQRDEALDRTYDLAVNLEDTIEVAAFLGRVTTRRVFGACLKRDTEVRYTADSGSWFDLGLLSVHGRTMADRLKWLNRRAYQELLFEGLGLSFQGERYLLPSPRPGGLVGDVALSTHAGPVWPMKNWAYYDQLQARLEKAGLRVNVLPRRTTLLEHLNDVAGHRCLVSGDSLPMHLALGMGVRCVTLFTCTSPWEIYDYGLQQKLVSPLLEAFWYRRGFDPRATTAIGIEEVWDAVLAQLKHSSAEHVPG